MLIEFVGLLGQEAKTAFSELTLNVDGTALAFGDASLLAAYLTWGYTPTSRWRDGTTVVLSLTAPAKPAKPAKPTGLSATAGNARVALSWTNPSDSSITKYQYLQKTGNATWGTTWTDIPNSAPGQANATSYTVTSLSNGTSYRFRIRAVNSAGNSPQSDASVAVTPQASTVTPPPPPPPPTDTAPSFGSATVTALTLDRGAAMAPRTLPRATGGNGVLSYGLTSEPAGLAGLSFVSG